MIVGERSLVIRRVWAMPSSETFSIPPIAALLDRVLDGCKVIVDPFARNSKRGTVTNDLNPDTSAEWHLPAEQFVGKVAGRADAALFDPPYSPRQISEVYQRAGLACGTRETQNGRLYAEVRDGLSGLVKPGGVAISCGWNSAGFGKGRGFVLEEILLVTHGGAHNDTIVTVERKEIGLFGNSEAA